MYSGSGANGERSPRRGVGKIFRRARGLVDDGKRFSNDGRCGKEDDTEDWEKESEGEGAPRLVVERKAGG